MEKCSRLEVITPSGREVVLYGNIEYEVVRQDNGKTVKIFVKVDESKGTKKSFGNIFKQE